MLTIKPIDSSLVDYYAHLGEAENHDYYSEDGVRPGQWWGEGAEALGLVGEVKAEEFENLFNGLSPDGSKELVQLRNGAQLKRRAGFDLTFSEVKSFDAAWALATPERRADLEAVAEQALERVLEVVQELCGVTRRGKDGVITENAKLIGAIFHHDTARGAMGKEGLEVPDPKKHHHVVIANVVSREDGTHGALDARPLFQRRMKMALGALFRCELSKLLETKLGIATYRPKQEHKDELACWYELQDVPPDLMRAMSKRRVEIESWLREHGLSGAKASEKANLRTRNAKARYTWQELSSAWEAMGREFEFDHQRVEALFGRVLGEVIDAEKESQRVIDLALSRLMEHKARFTENELLERTAIEAQSRGIGIDEVMSVVRQTLQHNSEIVRLEDSRGVKTFTTKAMLELEKAMLERGVRLHGKSGHAISTAKVNRVIREHPTLRPDQAKVVRAITTGSDLVAITGVAGSGKTFALSVVREVLEGEGYKLLGTSLASKASRGLQRESGIESLHIHKLLFEIQRGRVQLGSSTVLVIDEAGMVGTVHMEQLLTLVEWSGAKAVLVGDTKQLQSIAAGAPLRAIGTEVGTTSMTNHSRQREAWAQAMVQDLRDGNAEQALLALHQRRQLVIAGDREEAIERLVLDWTELVIEQGGSAKENLVFAGMNANVRDLNRKIQGVMKAHGQLGEYSIEIDGLDFHLGDAVMVTKNHNLLNLRNGTTGEVVGVFDKTLTILTEEGLEVEVDTQHFSDLTLGYSLSVHKAQGHTCENALLLTGDVMTDRELTYTAATRPRGKTLVYSDELSVSGMEELAERMNVSRQKEMALEHRLEMEE